MQFSFKEIFRQVERKDVSGTQLRILILLELVNYPLMIRQIADILEMDEYLVENKIPAFDRLSMSEESASGREREVPVNDEIRFLTRSLAQEHESIATGIRQKILRNFSINQKLDYTTEEREIIGVFENYLKQKMNFGSGGFLTAQARRQT